MTKKKEDNEDGKDSDQIGLSFNLRGNMAKIWNKLLRDGPYQGKSDLFRDMLRNFAQLHNVEWVDD